jgi:hypothetical protein
MLAIRALRSTPAAIGLLTALTWGCSSRAIGDGEGSTADDTDGDPTDTNPTGVQDNGTARQLTICRGSCRARRRS